MLYCDFYVRGSRAWDGYTHVLVAILVGMDKHHIILKLNDTWPCVKKTQLCVAVYAGSFKKTR